MFSRKDFSIYDAVFLIEQTFKKGTEEYKNLVISVAVALDKGHLIEEIIDYLEAYNFQKVHDLAKSINECKHERNLLTVGEFYFHNQLRIKNEPISYYFDINKGIMKKIEQDYYLEMKASYNMVDLYNYIIKKNEDFNFLYDLEGDSNRVIGSLNWLINSHGLENTLFLIDVAHDIISFNNYRPIRLIDISKYKKEAMDLKLEKKNTSIINGVDKVVCKKRK